MQHSIDPSTSALITVPALFTFIICGATTFAPSSLKEEQISFAESSCSLAVAENFCRYSQYLTTSSESIYTLLLGSGCLSTIRAVALGAMP